MTCSSQTRPFVLDPELITKALGKEKPPEVHIIRRAIKVDFRLKVYVYKYTAAGDLLEHIQRVI